MNRSLKMIVAVALLLISPLALSGGFSPAASSGSGITEPLVICEVNATQNMLHAQFNQMNFATCTTDTHSIVTNAGTAWRVTIPAGQDGDYRADAVAAMTIGSGVTYDLTLSVFKNGNEVLRGDRPNGTTTALSGEVGLNLSGIVPGLVAGDYLEIHLYNSNGGTVSKNTSGQAVSNRVSIQRVR